MSPLPQTAAVNHALLRRPSKLALALVAIVATSCSSSGTSGGPPAAFVGGAAVDEPRAAIAARDILAAGGSAVDAVTAAYFALSVTLPSSASLGGGGVCLVFDAKLGRIEAVDFMPRGMAAGGPSVPMNVRGFFIMQGRYGRSRWEQVVAPAEGLARFGTPVSRALASELADSAGIISASPDLARIFGRGGGPLREGDQLIQLDLANTLAVVRSRGGKDFHAGPEAPAFVAAARAAGARFTLEEFRAVAPELRAPVAVNFEGLRVAFAPPPANAGLYQAQLWQMLLPRWQAAPRDEQPHLLVEASRRAMAETQTWPSLDLADFATVGAYISAQRAASLMADYRPQQRASARPAGSFVEEPATTTLVAADKEGGAAACAVSMGARFGSGRVANGVVLAAPTQAALRGIASLDVMLAVRSYGGTFSLSPRANTGQVVFAGGAGNGPGAAAALVQTALTTTLERRPLDEAMDRPRLSPVDGGDEIRAEEGAAQRYPGLASRGHRLVPGGGIGRINAISCTGGLIDEPTTCRVRADTRGHGLAVGGVR